MVKVEIHSFPFICSKISVSQCEKFVLAKINVGYKLKDFSRMLGGRKRNSFIIPLQCFANADWLKNPNILNVGLFSAVPDQHSSRD